MISHFFFLAALPALISAALPDIAELDVCPSEHTELLPYKKYIDRPDLSLRDCKFVCAEIYSQDQVRSSGFQCQFSHWTPERCRAYGRVYDRERVNGHFPRNATLIPAEYKKMGCGNARGGKYFIPKYRMFAGFGDMTKGGMLADNIQEALLKPNFFRKMVFSETNMFPRRTTYHCENDKWIEKYHNHCLKRSRGSCGNWGCSEGKCTQRWVRRQRRRDCVPRKKCSDAKLVLAHGGCGHFDGTVKYTLTKNPSILLLDQKWDNDFQKFVRDTLSKFRHARGKAGNVYCQGRSGCKKGFRRSARELMGTSYDIPKRADFKLVRFSNTGTVDIAARFIYNLDKSNESWHAGSDGQKGGAAVCSAEVGLALGIASFIPVFGPGIGAAGVAVYGRLPLVIL